MDVLLRREDLPAAKVAFEEAGFVYRQLKSIDMFLDGPGAKVRDAVQVVFAGEPVKKDSPTPAPTIDQHDASGDFRVVDLEALVRMKLTAYRRKDQVHLLDMIEISLIDSAWPERLGEPLGERLQALLDDPDG